MKLIRYIPNQPNAAAFSTAPIPASKALPDWYKSIPQRINNEKSMRLVSLSAGTNATLKLCVPFLDSMTTGYTLVLPHDVLVTAPLIEGDVPVMEWREGGEFLVSKHPPEQMEGIPLPEEVYSTVYKWANVWGIQTPPGYSCWFTHPINRFDLPFLTLSGVVDTDGYNLPVFFPFFIKKGFSGVLERGTPIAQIFPFKREPWSSTIEDFNEFKDRERFSKFRGLMERAYKKLYWSKKTYT